MNTPIFFKKLNITSDDILSCKDHKQIQIWHESVLVELANVKSTIATAKAGALTGEYAEPKWFAKVNNYARVLGLLVEIIKRRRSEIKPKNERHLNSFVLDVIKEILPAEQVEEVINDAKQRHKIYLETLNNNDNHKD